MIKICEVCHKTPCSHRCPNASQPKIIGECAQCQEKLREDYEYYVDNSGNKYCSLECVHDYHGIKSKEWSDFY